MFVAQIPSALDSAETDCPKYAGSDLPDHEPWLALCPLDRFVVLSSSRRSIRDLKERQRPQHEQEIRRQGHNGGLIDDSSSHYRLTTRGDRARVR